MFYLSIKELVPYLLPMVEQQVELNERFHFDQLQLSLPKA